jgi:hypothetical protein
MIEIFPFAFSSSVAVQIADAMSEIARSRAAPTVRAKAGVRDMHQEGQIQR